MSLAYALPFFCDAMLYFGALGCFGLLNGCRGDFVWVPALLLAGCWLSGLLTGRGKPWLRWLPMAVAAPCMVAAGSVAGRLAALPMLVYLPLYVYNNRRAPDYDYAADRFRHSLIVAGAVALLAALIHAQNWKGGLPYLFLYFTLNMALLRLLRHDDRIARSARFRLINIGGVALVCALGFGLSQPGIVAALGAAWRWFLQYVVLNVLTLLAYALRAVLYLGAKLMSLFGDVRMDPAGLPQLTPAADAGSLMPQTAAEVEALPALVRFLIKAVGVAMLAALAFVMLRALSRQVARTGVRTGTDERESLDGADAPRAPRVRLRRAPEDGVRQQYRRALMLLRARGGRVAPNMNTLQIERENAGVADDDALRELRGIYLPARYGGRAPGREDVRRARAAYERLRAGARERRS